MGQKIQFPKSNQVMIGNSNHLLVISNHLDYFDYFLVS